MCSFPVPDAFGHLKHNSLQKQVHEWLDCISLGTLDEILHFPLVPFPHQPHTFIFVLEPHGA